MTYPNQGVVDYIGKNFIPVRFNAQTNPEVKSKYRILWAPTIIILDSTGTEYYRFNGFLPHDEFIPQLEFGLGKMALEKQDITTAHAQMRLVVEKYPKSDIAPEAQYWAGVIAYQLTHDVIDEVAEWKKIIERYPGSIWAKKVSCAVVCIKE
ncbi:MAG: thioredoxin family protein [Planctomycetes bacterium]|nr:thioredoxin family protein [Planctomycetota bacterium]